jgi:hypothetical protein
VVGVWGVDLEGIDHAVKLGLSTAIGAADIGRAPRCRSLGSAFALGLHGPGDGIDWDAPGQR